MHSLTWLVIVLLFHSFSFAQRSSVRETTAAVAAAIDDWHLAAAEADEERYFGRMASEAVFVGIIENERWTKDAFRRWAHPQFEARQVWDFKSTKRNIVLAQGAQVAWFDELLETSGMGPARGSGVLVKEGDVWLIAQYVLSLPPIPLKSFMEVMEVIRVQKLAQPSDVPRTPPDKESTGK